MSETPSSWVIAPLDAVCEILDAQRIPINSKERSARTAGKTLNELYPYYGATGRVGSIDDFIFQGEHVLLGEDGAPFLDAFKEKAYLADGKFWVNNHAHILKSKTSNKYVLHYLNQIDYSDFVNGTTRLKLTQADLKQIPIRVAPLNEQKRIVEKIQELFLELDKGIESLKSAREQLKIYRQSILKKILDNPDWPMRKFSDAIVYLTSGSRGWADYYSDAGDIFIRAQNIKFDRLNLDDVAYVALPTKSEGTRTKVSTGDILITITGANVTKSAIVEVDVGTAYVSQHVALCRLQTEIRPKFVYWNLVSESGVRKQLNEAAYGAGKPGLKLDNIRNVELRIPTHAEQVKAVLEIEHRLSDCDRLNEELRRQIEKSEALRQSILKIAFSGKLVPQDPNDEPASVLLERIKADEAKSSKQNKGSSRGKN